VGDSLDRDIEPAHALGMRTFWIANRRPGARAAADVVLTSIAALPASLREVA
jgi:FMN phosphatase YigB (HAD superfamily)